MKIKNFMGYSPVLKLEIKDRDKYCRLKIEKWYFSKNKGVRNGLSKESFSKEKGIEKVDSDLFFGGWRSRKKVRDIFATRDFICMESYP